MEELGFVFVVLLRDADDAKGVAMLLNDLKRADLAVAPRFIWPSVRGVDYFHDLDAGTSLETLLGIEVASVANLVYVAQHEAELPEQLAKGSRVAFVGVASSNETSEYEGLPHVRVAVGDSIALTLCAEVMTAYSGPDASVELFDAGEALSIKALVADYPLESEEGLDFDLGSTSTAARVRSGLEELSEGDQDLLRRQLKPDESILDAFASGKTVVAVTSERVVVVRRGLLVRLRVLHGFRDFPGERIGGVEAHQGLATSTINMSGNLRWDPTVERWAHVTIRIRLRRSSYSSCDWAALHIRGHFIHQVIGDDVDDERAQAALQLISDNDVERLAGQLQRDEAVERKAAAFIATVPILLGLVINNIGKLEGNQRARVIALLGMVLLVLAFAAAAYTLLQGPKFTTATIGPVARFRKVAARSPLEMLLESCETMELIISSNDFRRARKTRALLTEISALVLGAALLSIAFILAT